MSGTPVPSGCTMATVGHQCEVHLQLKGLVDVSKEVARLEDKISTLSSQLEKLAVSMSIENYEEKVRAEIREGFSRPEVRN